MQFSTGSYPGGSHYKSLGVSKWLDNFQWE